MRLKLDENLGNRARDILHAAGHEVSTVPAKELGAAMDDQVLQAAVGEGRALITLDLDFANPLRFLPSSYSGIVLLRLRSRPSLEDVLTLVRTLAKFLEREEPGGKLWIVERGGLGSTRNPQATTRF
jgi:predicted nuclease of predicted toxin-antitoxin system